MISIARSLAVELGESQPYNCISVKISFWSQTRGAFNTYRKIVADKNVIEWPTEASPFQISFVKNLGDD